MMRRQYCCLKKFWIAGSHLWFRWQSPEIEEESQRRMEEMLKEEDDIDALLERKVSLLGMLFSDKDKNSTEEKVLLGHILDLIDY